MSPANTLSYRMIALCTLQVDACLVTSRTRLRRTRSLKWSLCMQSGWRKGCSGLRSVINRDPVLRSPTLWLTCSLCNIQYGLTVQKNPSVTSTYTKPDTHTLLSPPLCFSATHCNFPKFKPRSNNWTVDLCTGSDKKKKKQQQHLHIAWCDIH